MNRVQLLIAAVAGLLSNPGGAAGLPGSPSETTPSTQTEVTDSSLTPVERSRASVWDLSLVEWQRYQSLMSGIRGSISPANISPIEVLGIHARDDAERKQYAERWAQWMHEDVERILAFQRAYDEAGRRLYPDQLMIAEAGSSAPPSGDTVLTSTDRILLFVTPECAPCDEMVGRAMKAMVSVAGVDIYLNGVKANDAASVRAWAARQGIPADWVKAGRVTLNFEAGTLARLGEDQTPLPVLLRRRGDTVTPLATGMLE